MSPGVGSVTVEGALTETVLETEGLLALLGTYRSTPGFRSCFVEGLLPIPGYNWLDTAILSKRGIEIMQKTVLKILALHQILSVSTFEEGHVWILVL